MEEVDLVDLRGENVKLQLYKAASASVRSPPISHAPLSSKQFLIPQDLKNLLGQARDHNALDANGDAPLHCFVKRKDREKFNCLMALLIHSKCDINLPNKDGQTALHLACQVKIIY